MRGRGFTDKTVAVMRSPEDSVSLRTPRSMYQSTWRSQEGGFDAAGCSRLSFHPYPAAITRLKAERALAPVPTIPHKNPATREGKHPQGRDLGATMCLFTEVWSGSGCCGTGRAGALPPVQSAMMGVQLRRPQLRRRIRGSPNPQLH